MQSDMFVRPVTILTGLGSPTPVRSTQEAYRILMEWPGFTRDAAHAFALSACRAALAGEIETETARGLFAALAEKHDLLAPNVSAIAAFRKRRGTGSHFGE